MKPSDTPHSAPTAPPEPTSPEAFDEIDAMRAGTSNPTRANAVAKLADQVVQTVHMELAVHKHASTAKATDKIAPTLAAAAS